MATTSDVSALAAEIAQGSMHALVLHGRAKGLSNEAIEAHLPALKAIVQAECYTLLSEANQAACMGDTMQRHVLNIGCNAWAVRALQS